MLWNPSVRRKSIFRCVEVPLSFLIGTGTALCASDKRHTKILGTALAFYVLWKHKLPKEPLALGPFLFVLHFYLTSFFKVQRTGVALEADKVCKPDRYRGTKQLKESRLISLTDWRDRKINTFFKKWFSTVEWSENDGRSRDKKTFVFM